MTAFSQLIAQRTGNLPERSQGSTPPFTNPPSAPPRCSHLAHMPCRVRQLSTSFITFNSFGKLTAAAFPFSHFLFLFFAGVKKSKIVCLPHPLPRSTTPCLPHLIFSLNSIFVFFSDYFLFFFFIQGIPLQQFVRLLSGNWRVAAEATAAAAAATPAAA